MSVVRSEWHDARRNEILRLRQEGMTYEAIGRVYGITRGRVHQIVHSEPLPTGPAMVRTLTAEDIANWEPDEKFGFADPHSRVGVWPVDGIADGAEGYAELLAKVRAALDAAGLQHIRIAEEQP